MRIGVDATTWWNDRGFGRFTRELLRALVRRGNASYTAVIDREAEDMFPSGLEVLQVSSGRPVTESAVQSGSRSVRDMAAMSRAVAAAAFDVFFFPAVYSFFPLSSWTPSVVVFHDMIAERFPHLVFPTQKNRWFWRAKVELARRQATRIMTVSDASARDITQVLKIPPHRIDVVSEAADPVFRILDNAEPSRRARAAIDVPEGVPLFVYVGGLNPHKNLVTLLRAMELVLERRSDVYLAIVGDVSKRGFFDNVDELTAKARANPRLSANVRFTGYVSDEDLVALYNGATALAYPSLLEGFGLPAVEAMQCGLPVAASARGSLPEVVQDAGLFFDPLLPSEIADRLLKLAGDSTLRDALAARAARRARRFTWDAGAALAEESFRKCARS